MIWIYILSGLVVGLSLWFIIYASVQNKRIQRRIEEIEASAEQKINEYRVEGYNKEKDAREALIAQELKDKADALKMVQAQIEEKNNFNSSLLKIREEELERLMEEKKIAAIERIGREVEEWAESAQEAAAFMQDERMEYYDEEFKENMDVLRQIKADLDEYKKKRDAVNQEILRSRAMEEQQDFYRVQLDDSSKEDIEVLNNVRQKLNKTDLLNKLIYDNYIARPVKEMIKRVLEGKNPSGIYKVTNIKTGEIYIGKSVKTADRFCNHVKSAYGLEGVAESQFQRALKKYGVNNFTWELLEEVPKENLNEAEKRWIEFYGTKDFGYNQRLG